MALTSLELKDKTFGTKFRGYDAEEVDEFLDIVTRDYEDLVQKTHNQESEIKSLTERLAYFDEMKESLSQSVIIAQDTADKVRATAEENAANIRKQAEYDAQSLLDEAKVKANDILRTATDNAKKVAVETEELKNKTRVFHQRLKSALDSQMSLTNSPDWEELLRPTASYIQTSDEAFREVLEKALREDVKSPATEEEEDLAMTRQLTPEELAEINRQAEDWDKESSEQDLPEETELEESEVIEEDNKENQE